MDKPALPISVAASRHRVILVAASLLIVAAVLWISKAHAAEPFNRGTVSGSLYIGKGSALGNTYTTLGAGLGYMVSDGLMAGISGESWFGNDPHIYKITPEVRYTFTEVRPVKPYVGAFVSRTFYSGLDDRNSYGVRGGVYFSFSSNAAVNVGLVYEKISNCNEATYKDCSQVYPEAGLLVSF
jgi:opacity protein-like surface antigen